MIVNTAEAEGARKILQESLDLAEGDTVAIFCDEGTEEPANSLFQEASTLKLQPILRFVPIADQLAYSVAASPDIALKDKRVLAQARAVLTCLSDNPAATNYRKDIVKIGTDQGRRLGHIPGLTSGLLETLRTVDHQGMVETGENVALALALAHSATLTTYARDQPGRGDRPYSLQLNLGGLSRAPIASTGLIPVGTWGNIPGGEVFIAPIEDSAEGAFVLNGSFKGHPLGVDQYLILRFESGALTTVEGPQALKDALLELIDSGSDRPNIAELGIGLNKAITALSGNSLLDEKSAGTVHIALGDNIGYGGRLRAAYHEDLVTVVPTLEIDGETLISRGVLTFEPRLWREDLSKATVVHSFFDNDLLVSRLPTITHIDNDGRLCVRREAAPGRLCTYRVGEDITSMLLGQLLAMIPPLPSFAKSLDIITRSHHELNITQPQVSAALAILRRHKILHTTNHNQDQ